MAKLNKGHEEFIYEHRRPAGRRLKPKMTGRQIREELARGIPGEPPVSIHVDRVYEIGRRIVDERDELFQSKIQDKEAPEGLRLLTRRLMVVAERETRRLEEAAQRGRLDAKKLGSLAAALTKLHTLLERNEDIQRLSSKRKEEADAHGQAKPRSAFADALLGEGHETPPEATQEPGPPIADRVVKHPVNGAQAG